MKVLVAGGSGATGQLLIRQLLDRGLSVQAIVRSPDKFLKTVGEHERLLVINASILELSDTELVQHVLGCGAVVSCLGHKMNFRGVYGKPRRLVSEATRRLCEAIRTIKPTQPLKLVLMNSTGCRNDDLAERVSVAEMCVVSLIRLVVPPHLDNEQASKYLRRQIGQQDESIEWTIVRPDTLVDNDDVSKYEIHPSPTRSAIFNAGQTSRINVAYFLADLVTEDAVWSSWKGQSPVIYNPDSLE
ncbi:NAD(P)-dependent oxidoreductase [Marinobacter adhaerens]|uniref:NAD(P)-dependent oxidoreductase n=1 Tax=Marinobacter adhaerens TaxID=1033846 RepID=UPI001C56276D|nr:NAD(P)-binding oxidoreductase [Marinobacter adhaerens]MBW3227260.1 SDR family oxidoreductase [Marinobacter adhaerens]